MVSLSYCIIKKAWRARKTALLRPTLKLYGFEGHTSLKHFGYNGLPYEALAKYGAGSRTRTDTVLPPRDFESRASANFAIPANSYFSMIKIVYRKGYSKRKNRSILKTTIQQNSCFNHN
jgi:hypothetical protein